MMVWFVCACLLACLCVALGIWVFLANRRISRAEHTNREALENAEGDLSVVRETLLQWKTLTERLENDLDLADADYDTLLERYDKICDEADSLEAALKVEREKLNTANREMNAAKLRAELLERENGDLRALVAEYEAKEAARARKRKRGKDPTEGAQITFDELFTSVM